MIICYVSRPYKQAIILPKNYEGIVVVQYNKTNGKSKKWINGFLGVGSSRCIEVDSNGFVKTQFEFHSNSIPVLGIGQTTQNKGGLKIFYEDDLKNEIVSGSDGAYYYSYKSRVAGNLNIYFTGFKNYPLIIFVVCKAKNYHKYFMTDDEIEEWMIKQKEEFPNTYIEKPTNRLNKKYSRYYN